MFFPIVMLQHYDEETGSFYGTVDEALEYAEQYVPKENYKMWKKVSAEELGEWVRHEVLYK